MKKLISTIATIALFIFISSSTFAQVTGTGTMVAPTGLDANDTVTLGSVMPYSVSGDPNMHALRLMGVLNYSNYTKVVPTGGVVRAFSGATGSTPNASDSAFSVAWSSVGLQTVRVTEVPVLASGPAFSCPANTQILNVEVIARPTAALPAFTQPSACGLAGTNVNIPVTATGTNLFAINYRISYTPLIPIGAAATDVVTSTMTNQGSSFNISYTVPAGAYGKYEVYITKVTDRISRKSGVTTSLAADLPAAPTTFYAYPVPATQPIRHIGNI